VVLESLKVSSQLLSAVDERTSDYDPPEPSSLPMRRIGGSGQAGGSLGTESHQVDINVRGYTGLASVSILQ
jgi:hypothetical protein